MLTLKTAPFLRSSFQASQTYLTSFYIVISMGDAVVFVLLLVATNISLAEEYISFAFILF